MGFLFLGPFVSDSAGLVGCGCLCFVGTLARELLVCSAGRLFVYGQQCV